MKTTYKKIADHFLHNTEWYIFLILFTISFLFTFYFYQNDKILLYGDSLSRLDISRKIFDNLTPGLAQLGNVWLPLPQIIMFPFVLNNFLWHSGLAGAVVSMAAYIIGGIFIFRSLKLLSGSNITSVLALSIYAMNINLLYLQTTAMSEPIFLCSIAISIFYFIKWIKFGNRMNLLPAAIAVSAATLIRYEALAILLASIPMVFFYTWLSKKNYHKAEGNLVIYTTLACLGFALWSLYLWAIFGDPLFWKNYYVGTHVVGDAATQLHIFTFHLNFIQAFWKYTTSVVWMNGLIPTILALIGIPILLIKSIKERSYLFLPVLLSLSMFAFMVLTLQRNTPIDQPELTVQSLLSATTSSFSEFNIRYGLLMLPLITLLSSYVISFRSWILKLLFVVLISVQFYSYFNPIYTAIYQIPISIGDNITQGTPKEKEMVQWLKNSYDGGLIMISALKHDPQMLVLGVDYKTYIHEGAGKYWKESINTPEKYATWIVFDSYNKDDQVTKFVGGSQSLDIFFDLVYNNDGMLIYKIKEKPLIDVSTSK